MTSLMVVALIFAVFAFDSILVIYVHRRAFGKFHVSADWQRLLAFTSCTGSFSIRNDLRQVHCAIDGHKTVVGFEDLRSLELRTEAQMPVLGEFILDPDMEEHRKEDRDYIVWNTISLICNDGLSIPIFKSRKYVRRKYLHDFYTEARLSTLELCGLLVNVDEQCKGVISRLQSRLDFSAITSPCVEH